MPFAHKWLGAHFTGEQAGGRSPLVKSTGYTQCGRAGDVANGPSEGVLECFSGIPGRYVRVASGRPISLVLCTSAQYLPKVPLRRLAHHRIMALEPTN
jgi:hypothetical protein